jgi:hypothetical protein
MRLIEKSNNDIGNRTRDLPACSIEPQPTKLPRAPRLYLPTTIILHAAADTDGKFTAVDIDD